MKHPLSTIGKPNIPKPKNRFAIFCRLFFGFALTLFAFSPFGADAQTTLNATGGSGTISGNIYAWSIGEMVLVSTVSSGNNTYTQGVLQAPPSGLAVEENHYLAHGLNLYPNPVAHVVYLQPSFNGGGTLSMKLFDLRGRLIMQRKAELQSGNERQQLDLSFLQEGTYLLRTTLLQDDKIYHKTFKLVKISIQ